MLEIARDKAGKAGLEVEFIEGDIAKIALNRKFDTVISMFSIMSYQITNSAIAAVCRLARECLVTDGLFMFDCWHGPAVLIDRPTSRVKEVVLNDKEKIIRFTESQLDIMNHIVNVNFKLWKLSDSKLASETHETHPMRFLFPQEIKYFLEVAGFVKIEFYPFLDLDRNLTENDWNMMVVGR